MGCRENLHLFLFLIISITFISEYILLIGIIDMSSQCMCMLISIHKYSVAFSLSFFVAVLRAEPMAPRVC